MSISSSERQFSKRWKLPPSANPYHHRIVAHDKQRQLNKGAYYQLTDKVYKCQNMTFHELCNFRTEVCPDKAAHDNCILEDSCPYSHCVSWHRRNPLSINYRPILCPNVEFWTGPTKNMRVSSHCPRGRFCTFSHTKEEQMYHPLVYKTQICRDWPNCSKYYCPFAHGRHEQRQRHLEHRKSIRNRPRSKPEWKSDFASYSTRSSISNQQAIQRDEEYTLDNLLHHPKSSETIVDYRNLKSSQSVLDGLSADTQHSIYEYYLNQLESLSQTQPNDLHKSTDTQVPEYIIEVLEAADTQQQESQHQTNLRTLSPYSESTFDIDSPVKYKWSSPDDMFNLYHDEHHLPCIITDSTKTAPSRFYDEQLS